MVELAMAEIAMWIAERRLQIADPGGAIRPISIRIGAPAPLEDGSGAGCAVRIEGLIDDVGPIRGLDSFQAVELACRWVRQYLADHRLAEHLQWPTGEPYIDVTHRPR